MSWTASSNTHCHYSSVFSGLPRQSYFNRLLFTIVRPYTKSIQQSTSTSIYCAIAPELEKIGGLYFNNCWFCKPSQLSLDQLLQDKLWIISDEIIDRFETGNLGPLWYLVNLAALKIEEVCLHP